MVWAFAATTHHTLVFTHYLRLVLNGALFVSRFDCRLLGAVRRLRHVFSPISSRSSVSILFHGRASHLSTRFNLGFALWRHSFLNTLLKTNDLIPVVSKVKRILNTILSQVFNKLLVVLLSTLKIGFLTIEVLHIIHAGSSLCNNLFAIKIKFSIQFFC